MIRTQHHITASSYYQCISRHVNVISTVLTFTCSWSVAQSSLNY